MTYLMDVCVCGTCIMYRLLKNMHFTYMRHSTFLFLFVGVDSQFDRRVALEGQHGFWRLWRGELD